MIIVSPTSFLAYLYTVMQGLRALEIEKKAQQIEARVAELGRHLGAYQEVYISTCSGSVSCRPRDLAPALRCRRREGITGGGVQWASVDVMLDPIPVPLPCGL